jgi:hypothetical protein
MPRNALTTRSFGHGRYWQNLNAVPNLSFFQGQLTPEPKKTFGDYLSQTGITIFMGLNLLLGLSPWIAKSPAVAQVTRQILTKPGQPLSANKQFFVAQVSDPQKLKEWLQRLISFAYLFQLNTTWQVGVITQQPSKLLTVVTGAIRESLQILKPAGFLQAGSYLSNFLWYAGETNDIKNNNNPAQRREWDPRRLTHLLFSQSKESGRTWSSELTSLMKYMMQDFQYALSSKPWRDFRQALRNKSDWQTPQSYQTAIGAQCNMAAFIGSLATLLAESQANTNYGKIPDVMACNLPRYCRSFTKIMAACSIIAYVPIVMRSLLNWKEKESLLTLMGVPLTTSYMVLLASREISTAKGFFAIGAPMINEGKRLNGKKYRAQVNYLKFLYRLSRQNPKLTAQDILQFLRANPNELKAMEKQMGKVRVNYILNILITGTREQAFKQVSLTNYLMPIMQREKI